MQKNYKRKDNFISECVFFSSFLFCLFFFPDGNDAAHLSCETDIGESRDNSATEERIKVRHRRRFDSCDSALLFAIAFYECSIVYQQVVTPIGTRKKCVRE